MTDEELDLLASAYVDGEATPEEVALVEGDPALAARVEEFRALAAPVGQLPAPPAGLAERHLAAAMAEFEAQGSAGAAGAGGAAGAADGSVITRPAGDGGEVIDLRARAQARRDRPTRPRRTLPSWMPAAAAFVLIGGGLVWAVGQTGGGDDDSEAASTAFDSSEQSDESAEELEADVDAGSDEAARSEAMEEAEEESADDAMSDEAVMAESAPVDDEEADAATATTGTADGDTDGGFEFRLDPFLSLDEIPDPDTLALDVEPAEVAQSFCGDELVGLSLGEPRGFVPLEVAGEPAELFLFDQPDGVELRILVDGDCNELTP